MKEGPTGLLVTTTEAAVDARDGDALPRRSSTDDTPEQTRRVFARDCGSQKGATASSISSAGTSSKTGSLEHGETPSSTSPSSGALAELMPASATRLRRDFVSLLCLVRAHAILYRASANRMRTAHRRHRRG